MATFTPVSTSDYTGTPGDVPTGFTNIDGFNGSVRTDGAAYHCTTGTLCVSRKDGTFSDDQYASSVLSGIFGSGNHDQIGVMVRTSADTVPTNDSYFAYVDDDSPCTVTYGKFVNGTRTDFALNSTVTTWVNTDELRLYVIGTTVAVQKNGTDVLSTTDASLSTGNPGICARVGGGDVMRGDDSVFGDVTAASAPVITSQPVGASAAVGSTAQYSVTDTGATSYQWQYSVNGGGTWASVTGGSGATTATYTTPTTAAEHNGWMYRCVLTNANGSTDSLGAYFFVRNLSNSGRGRRLPTSAWFARTKIKGGLRTGASPHLLRRNSTRTAGEGYDADIASAWADWFIAPAPFIPEPARTPLQIVGTRRNRPGRGPYSQGKYFRRDTRFFGNPASSTTRTTSGALAADIATVAGTATHSTLHTSSGALAAQASTVAGTATSPHLTSGALSADAATVAGTATHATLHATSGALAAQAATVSGTAADQHSNVGALAAAAANVAGTAAHLAVHASSGALAASAATLAGTAADEHSSSGALASQAATAAGTAAHLALHASSGALAADAATVAGTATSPHLSSGALAADAAVVAGTANHVTAHATSGVLGAQSATVTGEAVHPHTTTGALVSQAATVAGTAEAQFVATGALSAQAASVAGLAAHLTAHATAGALASQASTVAGTALHPHATTGTLVSQAATVSGAALHPHLSSGALTAQAAAVEGDAAHSIDGVFLSTGELAAQDATLAGTAGHLVLHTAASVLAAENAIIVGSASHLVLHASSGVLVAGSATSTGSAAGDSGDPFEPEAFWNYVLSNGKSAGQNVVEILAAVEALLARDCFDEQIQGPHTAGDVLRILAAVAAGKTRITSLGGGAANVQFDAIDESGLVVDADMAGSERTAVTLTPNEST